MWKLFYPGKDEEESLEEDFIVDIYVGDRETITAELLADEDFKNGALAYIAGYVVRKVENRTLCNQCKMALPSSAEDPLNKKSLEILKEKTKEITIPSESVFKIVKLADEVFEREVRCKEQLPRTPKLLLALTMKVVSKLDLSSLFPSLESHVLEQNPAREEMHSVTMVKLLAQRYFKVRFLSYIRTLNQNQSESTSKRNMLMKWLQFNNI